MTSNMIDDNLERIKQSLKYESYLDCVPEPFKDIKTRFKYIKEQGLYIIYEESGFPYTDAMVIYITDVYDRWCRGYSITRFNGVNVKVPRTIHYSDIYVQDKYNKVKIIVEGANPYRSELVE